MDCHGIDGRRELFRYRGLTGNETWSGIKSDQGQLNSSALLLLNSFKHIDCRNLKLPSSYETF